MSCKKVIFSIFTLFLSLIGFTYWLDDWLYHSSSLWLISLVDNWSTVLTLQDKNVGATCTDIDDSCSEGCLFQYWNNYCFTWSMSYYPIDRSTLDLSSYLPSTYNSNWYIMYNMDAVNNDNIWGFTSDNLIDKKWPCDTWYHVFLRSDISLFVNSSIYNQFSYLYFRSAFLFYLGEYWYDDVVSSVNSYNISNWRYWDLYSDLYSSQKNRYEILHVRCVKNSVVDPDSSWIKFQFWYISSSAWSSSYIVNYNNWQTQSFTTDQSITINWYSLYNWNWSFSPYINISYTDQDNQVLTESYDKTNLILWWKFEKTYTWWENNFWVLTALWSSTIPDIIFTWSTLTWSSNISWNIFTNFVDNSFDVIWTNIPNFISYWFVLIVLIILIRLIRHFKKWWKWRI